MNPITNDQLSTKLFHYTSIPNLALILESQKFRFSNYKTLDDLEEARKHSEYDFSNIAYASCWTESKEESIPLWNMYTPNMSGVRIGISGEIFPKYEVDLIKYPFQIEGQLEGPLKLYIPPQIWDQGRCMFFPGSAVDPLFKGKVNYVKSVAEEWEKGTSYDPNSTIPNICGIFDLIRTKNERWEFQDEYRFVVLIMPNIECKNYFSNEGVLHLNRMFHECLLGKKSPPIDYLDLPFDLNCLTRIEVTLGPKTTSAEKLIVEALLEKFAPQAQLKISECLIRK